MGSANNKKFDISIVVPAHNEGRLLRNTLRSIEAALLQSKLNAEVLLILDNASSATKAEASFWTSRKLLNFSIILNEVKFGNPGASRNFGVEKANAEVIAICDGDDLVSLNYFEVGLRALEKTNSPAVIHPEFLLTFGARRSIWKVKPSTDPKLSYLDLLVANLWPSSSMGRRQTYLDNPYPTVAPGSGMGPEDWLWNIQTIANGVEHVVAENVIFFYRSKAGSGVNHANSNAVLPWFDFEKLRKKFPVRTKRKGPSRGLVVIEKIVRRIYRAALPIARFIASGLKQHQRQRLHSRLRGFYSDVFGRSISSKHSLLDGLSNLLVAAAEIEPAISWPAFSIRHLDRYVPEASKYGEILDFLCSGVADKSDALVMVPWIGIGGADLVSLNYLNVLHGSSRWAGRVSAVATYLPERTKKELLPQGVNFVQLPQDFRALDITLQMRLMAQFIILSNPELVVSVNCFDYTAALGKYSKQMTDSRRNYLSLFAFDRIGEGFPVNPITDDAERVFLDNITGIITDNSKTASNVNDLLGLEDGKMLVHPQPAFAHAPSLDKNSAAYSDVDFSDVNRFRLLWPHRIDREKRPDALIGIAKEIRERDLPVQIDVYGQQVLSDDKGATLRAFKEVGINYRGPYIGGLSALETNKYHAMLLTSEWEGMPNVIPQSMLLSLPVISTNVGGISDLVSDRETGLLVTKPEAAGEFVDSIESILNDVELRRKIIENAYEKALSAHTFDRFTKRVLRDFGAEPKVS